MSDNLPPGVSDRDLAIEAGDLRSCDGCGRLTDTDKLQDGLCPRCANESDEQPK